MQFCICSSTVSMSLLICTICGLHPLSGQLNGSLETTVSQPWERMLLLLITANSVPANELLYKFLFIDKNEILSFFLSSFPVIKHWQAALS